MGGENEVEWTGKVKIIKKKIIRGSGRSRHGFIQAYSSFRGRTFGISGFSGERALISASAGPHSEAKRRGGGRM